MSLISNPKEAESIRQRRYDVNREVNSRKVDIDFSVFKKTDEERLALKQAKKSHKLLLKTKSI